ncbi:hypothetical protein BKA56DRAFT_613768 [Ilyonectria sp. MPI-CAGE-AT-0026]|nr:hypothetical protein BKA56DRAFT_613768 [Ilyonectria sp. MPI-CAGE-AT-0026]
MAHRAARRPTQNCNIEGQGEPECRGNQLNPHHSEDQNALLRLTRLDVAWRRDEADSKYTYGVHHGTVLSGCKIVAGNASTAYLSHHRRGKAPVVLSYDGILTYRVYFLQVSEGCLFSSKLHPVISLTLLGMDDFPTVVPLLLKFTNQKLESFKHTSYGPEGLVDSIEPPTGLTISLKDLDNDIKVVKNTLKGFGFFSKE